MRIKPRTTRRHQRSGFILLAFVSGVVLSAAAPVGPKSACPSAWTKPGSPIEAAIRLQGERLPLLFARLADGRLQDCLGDQAMPEDVALISWQTQQIVAIKKAQGEASAATCRFSFVEFHHRTIAVAIVPEDEAELQTSTCAKTLVDSYISSSMRKRLEPVKRPTIR